MFRGRLIPVWIGIILFSGMLLLVQGGGEAQPECVDGDGDNHYAFDPVNCPEGNDCDDTNPNVNPGLTEGPFGDPSCSDTWDNDCDWYIDTEDSACCECIDNDSDGYGDTYCENCTYDQWDCDDTNPNVNPGLTEGPFGDPSCSDGLDNDCDWDTDTWDSACCECIDNDGDGYGDPGCENCTYYQWDCDDTDANVNPAVLEDCANGIDDDCDSRTDGGDGDCPCVDDDGDGYGVLANPNCTSCDSWRYWLCMISGVPQALCCVDCDDTNANINPGVREGPLGDPSCSDALDNDCDWYVDTEDSSCCECIDNDGDGYGDPACEWCTYSRQDCDDTNANANPGMSYEVCTNGIDDDCDGLTDEEDGECPLLAVMDDSVGENSTVVSALLEIGGATFEYQETADFSGEALVYFEQSTGYLWILPLLATADTIDFSVPVWLWKITGTISHMQLRAYVGNIMWPGAIVDPSDGSFSTDFYQVEVTYVISAYFGGIPIMEDSEVYYTIMWPDDTYVISGTLVEVGDNDADGLNEYELTLNSQISVSMPMEAIPLIGEGSITMNAQLNLGFVAETLTNDSYEPDNFPDDGNFLLPGEVQNHVIHPDGDVDWIKVEVLEGHEYTVETLNLLSSWSDTVLEAYDDTGSLITENDDVDYDNGRFESRVSWIATYTGTYYVKARTSDGSSGHFDDQGGGEAFCGYDISFACSDLDGDGYGDPGSVLCTYPEPDCDDTNPQVNPGQQEIKGNGIDDDCNPDTPRLWNAPASVVDAKYKGSSDIVNYLFLLFVPIATLLIWKGLRRKR